MNRCWPLFVWLAGALVACGDIELLYPEEPSLEFVAFVPDTFVEPKDLTTDTARARIRLYYQDGDGDLGALNTQDTTQFNFFVFDTRPGLDSIVAFQKAILPNLSSGARIPSIQGHIEFDVVGLRRRSGLGTAPDYAQFEVYIVDRAGNTSNTVLTDSLVIVPAP